jgi:hypothetical protein
MPPGGLERQIVRRSKDGSLEFEARPNQEEKLKWRKRVSKPATSAP